MQSEGPEFGELAGHLLEATRGREAAFFTNPGNLGDALILTGALQLMHDSGVKFRYVDTRRLMDKNRLLYPLAYGKQLVQKLLGLRTFEPGIKELARRHSTAIVCGSGGWVSVYPDAQRLALEYARYFDKVIILPTTYASPIRDFPDNVEFFARDRYQSMSNNPRARFCHDTAFYLAPEPRTAWREIGYHIRTDVESAGTLTMPPGNVDISALGVESDPVDRMFDEVGQSRNIVTDRLHVAIAAALLGRRVWLFSSRYFKIPAIHRSSLVDRFPQVQLVGGMNELPEAFRWT